MNLSKIPIAQVVTLLIFIYSLWVALGWILGVKEWTWVLFEEPNMRFSTAFCFLLSSIALWSFDMHTRKKLEIHQVVIPVTATLTFLIMATLLVTGFLGAETGIDEILLGDPTYAVSASSGTPAIPTMVNFILFGIASIVSLFASKRVPILLSLISFAIGYIGIGAGLRYLFDIPILYFGFGPSRIPMAFNTAILFVLLSIGLSTAARKAKTTYAN